MQKQTCGRQGLIGLAMLLLSSGVLTAGTWTWDGGGGDSKWTTAANWSSDTVPDNNGTASLVITNVAGTLDMNRSWDIASLYIGGDVGKDMTLGSSGNVLTIRSTLYRSSYDQGWIYNAGHNYFNCMLAIGANGTVFFNDYGSNYRVFNTITDNGHAYDWIISGGIDMRDSNWDTPSQFSGRVVLKSGALYIRSNHALTNCTAWYVSGTLSSSDAGDKIGDSASVVLYGGNLTCSVDVEDVGDITLASGMCTLNPSGTGTIRPDTIIRGATPGARSLCRIQNLNATTTFIKPDSTTGLTLIGGDGSRITNKKIVPYMFDYTSASSQFHTLFTHDAVDGIVPLAADSDFVTGSTANFPAVYVDGNDNVLLTYITGGTDTITLTANTTVNSLIIKVDNTSVGSSHVFDLGGFTLNIKSGVLFINNEVGGTNDRLSFQNGTINIGTSEMVLLSNMGAPNNGLEFKATCFLRGLDSITICNIAGGPANLFSSAANISTVSLVDAKVVQMFDDSCATNAVIGGVRNGFDVNSNQVRPAGSTLVAGEVNGTIMIKPGRNTSNGTANMVIGGTAGDKMNNHIRLLGKGILSPHGISISAPDQSQLNGGVIGMSASDSGRTGPYPFVVDLHGGQVIIDLFSPSNYDQLRVIRSAYGDEPTLSLNAGNGTGSELIVRLHYEPDPSDSFTIVDVDGVTAVDGTFSNGESITANFGDKSYRMTINYTSGTGNDIVLGNAVLLPKGTVISVQ